MIRLLTQKFPPLNTDKGAIQYSKVGAIGGAFFAIMLALGMALLLQTPVGNQTVADAVNKQLILLAFVFIAVLLMSWRVHSTSGYISAILLLACFLLETGFNVFLGRANAFWIIVYYFIAQMLVSGIRGCWYFKNRRSAEPHSVIDGNDEEPWSVALIQDIWKRKGWYAKRTLLLALSIVPLFIISGALIGYEILQKLQVMMMFQAAAIYSAAALFSMPVGTCRKFLCWVIAIAIYFIVFQLLVFLFILLPSVVTSETSMQMLVKRGANSIALGDYINTVAALVGLLVQVRVQRTCHRNSTA
jgi:hypothetical protein